MLVWNLLGWPCLIGICAILLAEAVNALLAKILLHWERKRRAATDARLQISSQMIEAIRHLRWYGWQETWQARVMTERQRELNLKVITNILGILIGFTSSLASGMFPVAAFYAYTVWAGKPLRVDVIFPALQIFSMLESHLRALPDIIRQFLSAAVALERIEQFMHEPEKSESDTAPDAQRELELRDASFAWPGAQTMVLQDISLTFPVGMTVIHGKVGAGKTALLQALLGELDLKAGTLTTCGHMVGYCSQTPWLESMSIRDNILFETPFDPVRYKEVLEVCELTPDLALLKHGDLSEIGENGIGLSGGQKARVALARAVYSRSSVLLLDDPISALDHQTAESIVRRCFAGSLLRDRTTVLATHRVQLCRGIAQQLIEITDGFASTTSQDSIVDDSSKASSTTCASDEDEDDRNKKYETAEAAAVPDKFTEDEYRATGSVKAAVYWQYVKAGKLRWWMLLILAIASSRLIDVGRTWLLKQWGEAYDRPTKGMGIRSLFGSLPSPEDNVRPWLLAFLLVAVVNAVISLIVRCVMLVIVYCAGQQMFGDILTRVCNATFRFYDVTPVGRLMNRFTGDIGTIDGNISGQFMNCAYYMVKWVSAVVVIASITPVFLVFSVALTIGFFLIFMRFLPTSQSLRRLEMIYLSPLMTNFGALLNGLMTVRAFQAQGRFQDRNIAVTDVFQRMDHFYWSVQGWLSYRFDVLSAVSTFLLTLLALYTGVSPGLTAFALIAANNLVSSTHRLCQQYGQLQMDFVSVERVIELLHLEQEPTGTVLPPAVWPSTKGDIVFENVTIRYAPHMEPALSNVSFTIKGGASTAVVGRTG